MHLSRYTYKWSICISFLLSFILSILFHLTFNPLRLPQYTAQSYLYVSGEVDAQDVYSFIKDNQLESIVRQRIGIEDDRFRFDAQKNGERSLIIFCKGYDKIIVKQFVEESLKQLKFMGREITGLTDLVQTNPVQVLGGTNIVGYYLYTAAIFAVFFLGSFFLCLIFFRSTKIIRALSQIEDVLSLPCLGSFAKIKRCIKPVMPLSTYYQMPLFIQKKAENICALLQTKKNPVKLIALVTLGKQSIPFHAFASILLGCAMHKQGKRILLFDGDFQVQRLTRFAQIQAKHSLFSYANGEGLLSETVCSTDIAGIDFLSTTKENKNTDEHLTEDTLMRLSFEMEQTYDTTFIAITDYLDADQARLLSLCDCLIPIVSLKCQKKELDAFSRFIKQIPLPCRGFIAVFPKGEKR